MNLTFFDYPYWSKGKLINNLIEHLPKDWCIDIMNWSVSHPIEEFTNRKENIFFTSIGGLIALHRNGIELKNINVICHDEDDFLDFKRNITSEDMNYYLNSVRGFCVPSNGIVSTLISHGLSRIPQRVYYGIKIEEWEYKPRNIIKTIGICGKIKRHIDPYFKDSKRSHLIKKLADNNNLTLLSTDGELNSYDDVKNWYTNVDLIVVAGIFEGGPLSPFEAALSGIPVIGSYSGSWVEMAYSGGGIVLPINDTDFIKQGTEAIKHLQQNPELLQNMLDTAREYVKYIHDVKNNIHSWMSFLLNPTTDFI